MRKRAIAPEGVFNMPESVTPVSNVLISGDLLFLSGQAGLTKDGKLVDANAQSEVRQALTNLKICLESAGCDADDCLQVTCYLASLDDFQAYNDVFREFFHKPYPSSGHGSGRAADEHARRALRDRARASRVPSRTS